MRGSTAFLLPFVLPAVAAGLISVPAFAAPIRGTVVLPDALKSPRKYRGYWRVENGVVPVQSSGGRGDTVVVVTGGAGQPPAAKTVTVDISGTQATPATVVVGEGSVVEFKNGDKMPYDLSTPEQPSLMPLERLPAGGVRRQRFGTAGGYVVRCAEHPHMVISVVVVGSPMFAVVDDKGNFRLPEVDTAGKLKLKVWSQGKWVHEQEVDGRNGELKIEVAPAKAADAAGEAK